MSEENFLQGPILCYILDGVLVVYCIIATALFFREKFSFIPPEVVGVPEENGRIYQELDRPRDADPYQVLEPTKRKKRAKKKKPKPTSDEERNTEPSESLVLRDLASPPPLPPQ